TSSSPAMLLMRLAVEAMFRVPICLGCAAPLLQPVVMTASASPAASRASRFLILRNARTPFPAVSSHRPIVDSIVHRTDRFCQPSHIFRKLYFPLGHGSVRPCASDPAPAGVSRLPRCTADWDGAGNFLLILPAIQCNIVL